MNTEHALQLWKSSRSEGLPAADCTFVHLERLLHLERAPAAPAELDDPRLRLLVHAVIGAHGYSQLRPGKRRAPSAGARYPIDCLALTWRDGAPRLWMVTVEGGTVARLSDAYTEQVVQAIGAQPGEDHVVIVASLWKTIERYGLAGVRYTVYDAGHVLSNLTEFAHDEGQRLGLDLTLQARCVFRELPKQIVALHAVRLSSARPLPQHALAGLYWPAPDAGKPTVHVDPPSFSPLLARARRLFAQMSQALEGQVLPPCEATRQARRGVDWLEARRSVKGFAPRPATPPATLQALRDFLVPLFETAQRQYGVQLGLAHFVADDQGQYRLAAQVALRDPAAVPEAASGEAFVRACNGQAQARHAEAISVMFVQLEHLPPERRLAAISAAQTCIGVLSAEIYRHCALDQVGTTMLCGFSSQKLGELLGAQADWPLALHLYGRPDPAGFKSDISYLQ